MIANILINYMPYALVTNFTPGPSNILALNAAKSYGINNSKKILFGICTGFTCVMALSGGICLSLKTLGNMFQEIMKYIGLIYFLWLAWHILQSKPTDTNQKTKANNSFWLGFITQFFNIKVLLYGNISLSVYILPYTDSLIVVIMFIALMSILGSIAAITWALVGNAFQRFLNRNYKIVNLIMSLILIKCGIDLVIKNF